jgi:hypothetical protein
MGDMERTCRFKTLSFPLPSSNMNSEKEVRVIDEDMLNSSILSQQLSLRKDSESGDQSEKQEEQVLLHFSRMMRPTMLPE